MRKDTDKNGKPLTEQQVWMAAVCDVTGWLPAMMAGRAGRLIKALKVAGATPDELRLYYGQADEGAAWWWYRDDWRGKRGQRPGDGAIRETWGAWALPLAVAAPVRSEPAGLDALRQYMESRSNG